MKKLKEALKNNFCFWLFAIIALLLLIVSFILPPTGSIDPSVLQAVGECFAFASLGAVYKALDKGIDAKISKGDTSLTINNPDKDDDFIEPQC